MTKRPKREGSARAVRRAADRQAVRNEKDLERLEALEPGGAADRPIDVVSAAEVEARATARPCPLCGGSLRVESHEAETRGEDRLRVARVVCRSCHRARARYFRVAAPIGPN